MTQVRNWQLGRDMAYPYEAAYPERQFAFVFNVNRCIACQSCTMACKSTWTFSKGQEQMWWANVETKPYGGYPMFWDIKILDLLDRANPEGRGWRGKPAGDPRGPYGSFEGRTIFEAERMLTPDSARVLGYLPTDEEWNSPNIYEDTPVGPPGKPLEFHKTGPSSPSTRRGSSTWRGSATTAPTRPVSPRARARRSTSGPRTASSSSTGASAAATGSAPRPAPTRSRCTAATPGSRRSASPVIRASRAPIPSRGQPMETRCMAACIGHIPMQGLVKLAQDGTWAEDRQNPLYYLVHVARVALPLYPQFGTQPNGYYIPPRWVPRPYLRQMFGPGVDQAIERYENPDRELLAVLQLFRRSSLIIYGYKVIEGPKIYESTLRGKRVTLYNDTVIAYGKDGQEIFRTTVEEPIHVRARRHANSI